MLNDLGKLAKRWVQSDPATNVYGAGRSILALASASTLAFTSSADLFRSSIGASEPSPECFLDLARYSLFCMVEPAKLEIVRWLAVGILLVVASGYRPRLTGFFHWWIPFSLAASMPTVVKQGGDEVVAVLTLVLLPVTLLDNRRWHWTRIDVDEQPHDTRESIRRLVAGSCLLAARVQVAAIYFHSAVAKFDVPQWVDGTALYYWFNQPIFPTPDWAASLIRNSVLARGVGWGTLALELALALALFAPRQIRSWLLIAGIAFHAGIGLTFGLLSFGLAMAGALVLFLRPFDRQLSLPERISGFPARFNPSSRLATSSRRA